MSDTYRPMKFAYTYSAKCAQFPYKYYMKHSWLFKYYFLGVLVGVPIFYKIQKLSYSPANVEKWDKKLREQYGPPKAHH